MVYMRIIVGYEEVVQCLFLTRLHEDVEEPLFLSNESLKARQFGAASGAFYQNKMRYVIDLKGWYA